MKIILAVLLFVLSTTNAYATSVSWVPLANSAYSKTQSNQRGILFQHETDREIIGIGVSVGKTKLLDKTTTTIDASNLPVGITIPMENGNDWKLTLPKLGTYTRETSGQDGTLVMDYRKKFYSKTWREGRKHDWNDFQYEEGPSRFSLAGGIGWRYSRTSYSIRHKVKLLDSDVYDSFTNPFSYTKDNNCPVFSLSANANWDFVTIQVYGNTDVTAPDKIYWATSIGMTF